MPDQPNHGGHQRDSPSGRAGSDGPHRALGADGRAATRVAAALLLGVAVGVLVGLKVSWPYAPAAGWITAAAAYLIWTWWLLAPMNAEHTEAHARRRHEDDTRRVSQGVVLMASVASLAGVGYLLAAESGPTRDLAAAIVGILSVTASWFAIHTVFTLRYARLFYTAQPTPGGIDFHQKGLQPDYPDFAYVAFTVGMTYQVSDTDIDSKLVRRSLLGHSLLSYLFGTVIIAVTINLVASLIH